MPVSVNLHDSVNYLAHTLRPGHIFTRHPRPPSRGSRASDEPHCHTKAVVPGRVPGTTAVLMEPSRSTKRASHRSEEHTSELQSLMRISYAVYCLKKIKKS